MVNRIGYIRLRICYFTIYNIIYFISLSISPGSSMDRMSDSGSDDTGSNPVWGTRVSKKGNE